MTARFGTLCDKSLSSIARAITGTAWNGPRFFGLREVNSRTPENRHGG